MSAGQVAAELAQEIADLTKCWEIEREIIRRYIDKAPLEEVEHKIMALRYVECLPFKLIQRRIGYERSRMYDYHNSALEKIGLDRTPSDL